jgi:flagellar hook assembly protein FlgD
VPSGDFALRQNVPNPFHDATSIVFELPSPAKATVSIFDTRGRLVRRLVDANLPAGVQRFEWNGLTERGTPASSGVYFYTLRANKHTATKKLLLLR